MRDLTTGHVETVTYAADFELTFFGSGQANATGNLWPGRDEEIASGFVIDRNGRAKDGGWVLGNFPGEWRYNLETVQIYALGVQAINEDNHEIYYLF